MGMEGNDKGKKRKKKHHHTFLEDWFSFGNKKQLLLRSIYVEVKQKLNCYQLSCVLEALGGIPWSIIYFDYNTLLIKAQSIVWVSETVQSVRLSCLQ